MSEIKVGDAVTVRGVVHDILSNGTLGVHVVTGAELFVGVCFTPIAIATHTPAPEPIKVGDRVRFPPYHSDFIVRAIIDDKAWLWFENNASAVGVGAEISDLTRIPDAAA